MTAVLEIRGLRVTYPGPPPVRAVDDLDLRLEPGECLGMLGESGSGKSTLAKALLGLVPEARVDGSMLLGDVELTTLDADGWRELRWRRIALAFQSATALNPVLRVGEQIAEPLRAHLGMDRRAAALRARRILDDIGLGGWAASRYPRELSGGQKRLVLLAVALACDPEVLILDEPTSGLDPVTRRHVLSLLRRLHDEGRTTMLMISHDPEALGTVADRVAVLYRGWAAEVGPAEVVLHRAEHPYSWGLLNALPTLATIKDIRGIRGAPPDPTKVAAGCPFVDRCTQVVDACHDGGRPGMVAPTGAPAGHAVSCVRGGLVPVLRGRDLLKTFTVPGGLRRGRVMAVDHVDVDVRAGEVVGLVGPSGAGKSTLGMLLLRLLDADGGTVELNGQDLLTLNGKDLTAARAHAQMLFQDPYEALSPRLTVAEAIREPLDIQKVGTEADRDRMVCQSLKSVRLTPPKAFMHRHTHELSGGQLQRVALARALVLEPQLLVADEPTAMLDPSEQAKLLQLLKRLQVSRGMAMVFVSHDLAVVLRVADRVIVLDRGAVIEEATSSQLFRSPAHPVTQGLLSASGRDMLFGAGNGHAPAAVNGSDALTRLSVHT